MTLATPKGPGLERFYWQSDDLVYTLTQDFKSGKPMRWPVVSKELLHKVWSAFIDTGRVSDEQAFERIHSSMEDSLCHLLVANIVSGHDGTSPTEYLEDYLPADQHEPFCDWLINDDSGHWRISDYGTKPLLNAMALAFEATTLPAKLKYLDQALHITHMRGALSRLFVEGGRNTVMEVGLETLEALETN